MNYEINVSLNGVHHFATAPRSITSAQKAWAMLEQFKVLFPVAEGYNVTCARCESFSTYVAFDDTGKEVEVQV